MGRTFEYLSSSPIFKRSSFPALEFSETESLKDSSAKDLAGSNFRGLDPSKNRVSINSYFQRLDLPKTRILAERVQIPGFQRLEFSRAGRLERISQDSNFQRIAFSRILACKNSNFQRPEVSETRVSKARGSKASRFRGLEPSDTRAFENSTYRRFATSKARAVKDLSLAMHEFS